MQPDIHDLRPDDGLSLADLFAQYLSRQAQRFEQGEPGPDLGGEVIPHDQVHRTHLGSLQGFLAEIKRTDDVVA